KAQAMAEVTAVQNRLSVISRESLPVMSQCGELGILYLCYKPLGRMDAPKLGDRIAALAEIGRRREVSPQRVALAWLLPLGEHVLPIPGATTEAQVLDNIAAGALRRTSEEIAQIENASGDVATAKADT